MKRFSVTTCLSQLVLVAILVGYGASVLQLAASG